MTFAESGDVFYCPDMGEALVASGSWRLGFIESTKHRAKSRACGVDMSWLGGGSFSRCLLHEREDPRIHLKMASVGLER